MISATLSHPTTTEPPKKKKHRKSGPTSHAVVDFPVPKFTTWEEPASFAEALSLHMKRHGDTCGTLCKAMSKAHARLDVATIRHWVKGSKSPRTVESLAVLASIERRYRLPKSYFKARLPHPSRSATGHHMDDIGAAERRRLAWHLPDDFDQRSSQEQADILAWIRQNIVSGGTEYRRYQARAMKQRFAVRFPDLIAAGASLDKPPLETQSDEDEDVPNLDDAVQVRATITAPPPLAREMASLIRFKTATLTDMGFQRNGVWGEATAQQKIEHLGLLFGAMVSSPKSDIAGLGIAPHRLSFALLVFPAIWDWYVNWREKRRGFYTAWEIDMLRVGIALTRADTGWLRQNPHLMDRLEPVPGLVTRRDINAARKDWAVACEVLHKHAAARVKEIQRVARVHRDPFEPILAVLEAPSPLAEYRKISDEILRLRPDEARYPVCAAEAARSYLMLRLGMHLGLRQRNLRELLVCRKGEVPRSERVLTDRKQGELRWSERDQGWEVFIPSVAFKNAQSSYFGKRPFRLVLPNLEGLYPMLEAYLDRHRAVLLRGATDPGTFFVKTMKRSSKSAAYDQNTFYEAWRLTIQRYGVFNPYTGRGAIKGLLPHGPHNIRDVLATHILKRTGSYEQASYAIQDTPAMVAQHYGRFLPQDKAALAAQILNKVWEAA
jgi:hypothetical protein